jgi:hypothetical protein
MDTSTYTLDGDHPMDRIYKDKEFITELSRVGELYFSSLVDSLGLDERGEELLFDYIYNEDKSIDFEEYLGRFSLQYEDLLNPPPTLEL